MHIKRKQNKIIFTLLVCITFVFPTSVFANEFFSDFENELFQNFDSVINSSDTEVINDISVSANSGGISSSNNFTKGSSSVEASIKTIINGKEVQNKKVRKKGEAAIDIELKNSISEINNNVNVSTQINDNGEKIYENNIGQVEDVDMKDKKIGTVHKKKEEVAAGGAGEVYSNKDQKNSEIIVENKEIDGNGASKTNITFFQLILNIANKIIDIFNILV